MYHKETTIKEIQYNLYGKGKIPCILVEHYGHHRENSTYNYCYKQEVIEKKEYEQRGQHGIDLPRPQEK